METQLPLKTLLWKMIFLFVSVKFCFLKYHIAKTDASANACEKVIGLT